LDEDAAFQIISDYLLLREYDMGRHVDIVKTIAKRFRREFFLPEEIIQIQNASSGTADEASVNLVF